MAFSEPIVETWALYGCGSLLILLRLMCRWRMVGLRGFDPDDYMVGFSWVTTPPAYYLLLVQKAGWHTERASEAPGTEATYVTCG